MISCVYIFWTHRFSVKNFVVRVVCRRIKAGLLCRIRQRWTVKSISVSSICIWYHVITCSATDAIAIDSLEFTSETREISITESLVLPICRRTARLIRLQPRRCFVQSASASYKFNWIMHSGRRLLSFGRTSAVACGPREEVREGGGALPLTQRAWPAHGMAAVDWHVKPAGQRRLLGR